MDQAAAKVISDGLGVQPVFACPSDFGWVSRPRLWWTSVDWTRFPVDPDDGTPLEWAKKGKWERLRLASARPSADTFDLGGLAFHPSVATGRRLMPCATTPAPTEEGRPKPRATRGKTSKDTDARWSDGKRQYAPWHYQLEAMLQDSQGVLYASPRPRLRSSCTAFSSATRPGRDSQQDAPPHDRERLALGCGRPHPGLRRPGRLGGPDGGGLPTAGHAQDLDIAVADPGLGGPSVGLRPPHPGRPHPSWARGLAWSMLKRARIIGDNGEVRWSWRKLHNTSSQGRNKQQSSSLSCLQLEPSSL